MAKIEMLMTEQYNLLMEKGLEAFNRDGDFDYSQFENSSGMHPGELVFVLLLCFYEEKEDYEKCARINELRTKFIAKFGVRQLKDLQYQG